MFYRLGGVMSETINVRDVVAVNTKTKGRLLWLNPRLSGNTVI